jgi:hypothetical protein
MPVVLPVVLRTYVESSAETRAAPIQCGAFSRNPPSARERGIDLVSTWTNLASGAFIMEHGKSTSTAAKAFVALVKDPRFKLSELSSAKAWLQYGIQEAPRRVWLY